MTFLSLKAAGTPAKLLPLKEDGAENWAAAIPVKAADLPSGTYAELQIQYKSATGETSTIPLLATIAVNVKHQ